MGILVEAISVVIRSETLERLYPGGVAGYEADCPNATWCCDGSLTRVGFMTPDDVQAFVKSLKDLFGFEMLDSAGCFRDIAIVDQGSGPTRVCSWLQFELVGDGYSRCWLTGHSPGELATPAGWDPSHVATITFVPNEQMPTVPIQQSGNLDQVLDSVTGNVRYMGRPFPSLQRSQQLFRDAHYREDEGDLFGALALYQEARDLQPENANLWYTVGVLRQRLDGPAVAIADYEGAVALDPSLEVALCNLGGCLNELGRSEEALSYLRRATSLDPEDPIAWWTRAEVEYQLKLADHAHSYRRFIEAVESRPIGDSDESMIAIARARVGFGV